MKLWIDDVRPAPDGWIWAMTLAEALNEIATGDYDEVSFDHDLGGDDTAMPVAKRIEELAYLGDLEPPKWRIHSANPVGRANLKAALESADRFWAARERGLERERYGS
jgi:hypothetical protein